MTRMEIQLWKTRRSTTALSDLQARRKAKQRMAVKSSKPKVKKRPAPTAMRVRRERL